MAAGYLLAYYDDVGDAGSRNANDDGEDSPTSIGWVPFHVETVIDQSEISKS